MTLLSNSVLSEQTIDERILEAALDLFVEKGFHNVSVHEVQARAGVSIGSIYKYFGGKEGIARSLYEHLLAEFEMAVEDAKRASVTAVERCNRLIGYLFELTESRRNIVHFVLHAQHREFLADAPPICSARPFRAMREIIVQGMQNGEIQAADAWVAAAAVFGPALRMIHLRLDGLIESPLPEYLQEVQRVTWLGLQAGIGEACGTLDPAPAIAGESRAVR